MLSLCLMLSVTYYAQYYAGIVGYIVPSCSCYMFNNELRMQLCIYFNYMYVASYASIGLRQ